MSVGRSDLLHPDELWIELLRQLATLVEYVGHAVGHAGAEVAAGLAKDDHDPFGHILAAVVSPDTLDDGLGFRCCVRRSARRHAQRRRTSTPVAP